MHWLLAGVHPACITPLLLLPASGHKVSGRHKAPSGVRVCAALVSVAQSDHRSPCDVPRGRRPQGRRIPLSTTFWHPHPPLPRAAHVCFCCSLHCFCQSSCLVYSMQQVRLPFLIPTRPGGPCPALLLPAPPHPARLPLPSPPPCFTGDLGRGLRRLGRHLVPGLHGV